MFQDCQGTPAAMVDRNYPLKFEQELEEQLNDIDEYITSQLVQTKVKREPEDIKNVKISARYDNHRSSLPHLYCQPSWTTEASAFHYKGAQTRRRTSSKPILSRPPFLKRSLEKATKEKPDFRRSEDSTQMIFQRITPQSCCMIKQPPRFLTQPAIMEQKPENIKRDSCMERSTSSLQQQLSKLQMACDQRVLPLMSCRYQTLVSPRPTAVEKVVLRPGTPLDKRVVTCHYSRDSRIQCAIEQQDLPGLVKIMGKEFTWTGGRRRANGHKSAEEDFWWACGFCFFERRKKSTIKAHVLQRVCRKPTWRNHQRIRNAPPPIRRSASYDATVTNGADDPYFLWTNSLSV